MVRIGGRVEHRQCDGGVKGWFRDFARGSDEGRLGIRG